MGILGNIELCRIKGTIVTRSLLEHEVEADKRISELSVTPEAKRIHRKLYEIGSMLLNYLRGLEKMVMKEEKAQVLGYALHDNMIYVVLARDEGDDTIIYTKPIYQYIFPKHIVESHFKNT